MKNQKNQIRIFTFTIVIIFSAIVHSACSLRYENQEEKRYFDHIQKLVGFDIRNIEQVEKNFHNEPSIKMGYKLMDVFTHYEYVKDYKKALYYGKKCIEMGADKTCYGLDVSLLMAANYYKTGKSQDACRHLKNAFKLDTENEIEKFSLLKKEGINEEFIARCQQGH